MRQIKYIAWIALLLAFAPVKRCTASDSTAIQKQCFIAAKQEIEEMLQHKQPLSYERALFLVENAYYENQLDYDLYRFYISVHAALIKENIDAYKRTHAYSYKPDNIYQRAQQSPAERQQAYERLLANWAIYNYFRDTIAQVQLNGKNITYAKTPFTYCFGDPLGTTDFSNTQVSHLLDTKTGNCFALASLFKIFSERLGSGAILSTAPGHIFIRHEDENGRLYNLELSNGLFPGSGTIETLTYTTSQAVNSNIAMRDLDLKQSVALTLVYLAKGYEYRFKEQGSDFMAQCAAVVLQADSLSLNAMLLQSEYLQNKLQAKGKTIPQLQDDQDFKHYEQLITRLYDLGYREMPLQMKNLLIKGWSKDTSVRVYITEHNAPETNRAGMRDTRYASISWGLFDEEIKYKPVERYGNILFDTKKKKITQFAKEQTLCNDYVFDPAVFAMNVDPLAHKHPGESPYIFVNNNPIIYFDPDGRDRVWFNCDGVEIKRTVSKVEIATYVQIAEETKYNGARVQHMGKFAQAPMPGVITGYEEPKYQKNDYQIAASTYIFNRNLTDNENLPTLTPNHVLAGGNPSPVDVNLVKAMATRESQMGTIIGESKTGLTDIMQVNNSRDWTKEKAKLGLSKGMNMNTLISVRAALNWLYLKGMACDGVDKDPDWKTEKFEMKWSGDKTNWWNAVQHYNGGGNPNYLNEVQQYYQNMLPATPANYSTP